ncbi:MAG: hypothetical protein D6714_01830 [Bacteroidetes bacterium]|nr:MAG: hypothetical protein D6714_01830 [Bacteroidota bacterium]
MNQQYTFDSKLRMTLLAGMGLGLLCLIASWFADPAQIAEGNTHMRFWTNLLHNTTYFTGIAFIAVFTLAAFTTAYAGWYVVFKRVWEAYSYFLIPGIILLLIIGLGNIMHFHHLYHWADPAEVAKDEVLQGKSSFLNNGWYTGGTLIIVGAWIFYAMKLRSLSIQEDSFETRDYAIHQKTRVWAASFLPIAAFSSAAMIWLWVMSVDAHWYSTMFAWYSTASWFVGAMALTILTLIYLKSKGYYEEVTVEHLHDLGKYMFAFSVFWTYLWFDQYMLIWYANVGEETIYFKTRVDHFPVLFYANLVINFVLPFLILMRNSTKRKIGTLVFTSVLLLFGHWMDFFLMIKPGTLETAQHVAHSAGGHGEHAEHAGHAASDFFAGFTLPGLLELGIGLGFLCFFLYIAFTQLTKANLVPVNDPYLDESLHHEVLPDYSGGEHH